MERMMMQPTGVERKLKEDEIIVSKTDPSGRIMYVNQTFLKISDFTQADVIGQPHSMVRHKFRYRRDAAGRTGARRCSYTST